MSESANALKILYPKLLHITCWAHTLNCITEELRDSFEYVDDLISNGSEIFLKAPLRVQRFRDFYPNVPLPPQVTTTKSETWLHAAKYYNKHLQELQYFVNNQDEDDVFAINRTKDILKDFELKQQLSYITYYSFIADTIAKLKERHSLSHYIKVIDNTIKRIQDVPDSKGLKIKIDLILQNNIGFHAMRLIARLFDRLETNAKIGVDYSAKEISCFKYAPITCFDVERKFPTYLEANDNDFEFDNFKKYFFIYANNALKTNNICNDH